jgi:hypothetical protein
LWGGSDEADEDEENEREVQPIEEYMLIISQMEY